MAFFPPQDKPVMMKFGRASLRFNLKQEIDSNNISTLNKRDLKGNQKYNLKVVVQDSPEKVTLVD